MKGSPEEEEGNNSCVGSHHQHHSRHHQQQVGTVYCSGGIFFFSSISFQLPILRFSLFVSLSVVLPLLDPHPLRFPGVCSSSHPGRVLPNGQLWPSLTDRRDEAASATALDRTADPSFLSPVSEACTCRRGARQSDPRAVAVAVTANKKSPVTNELGSWLRRGRNKQRGTKGCRAAPPPSLDSCLWIFPPFCCWR
jgi:hypothetical protein